MRIPSISLQQISITVGNTDPSHLHQLRALGNRALALRGYLLLVMQLQLLVFVSAAFAILSVGAAANPMSNPAVVRTELKNIALRMFMQTVSQHVLAKVPFCSCPHGATSSPSRSVTAEDRRPPLVPIGRAVTPFATFVRFTGRRVFSR